jgi:hypothetical protein
MEGAEIEKVGVHVQLESKGCSFPGFMCCLPGEGEKSYLLGIYPRVQRLINHVQKGGGLACTGWPEDPKHLQIVAFATHYRNGRRVCGS